MSAIIDPQQNGQPEGLPGLPPQEMPDEVRTFNLLAATIEHLESLNGSQRSPQTGIMLNLLMDRARALLQAQTGPVEPLPGIESFRRETGVNQVAAWVMEIVNKDSSTQDSNLLYPMLSTHPTLNIATDEPLERTLPAPDQSMILSEQEKALATIRVEPPSYLEMLQRQALAAIMKHGGDLTLIVKLILAPDALTQTDFAAETFGVPIIDQNGVFRMSNEITSERIRRKLKRSQGLLELLDISAYTIRNGALKSGDTSWPDLMAVMWEKIEMLQKEFPNQSVLTHPQAQKKARAGFAKLFRDERYTNPIQWIDPAKPFLQALHQKHPEGFVEGVYQMMDRITSEFPEYQIIGKSSGGKSVLAALLTEEVNKYHGNDFKEIALDERSLGYFEARSAVKARHGIFDKPGNTFTTCAGLVFQKEESLVDTILFNEYPALFPLGPKLLNATDGITTALEKGLGRKMKIDAETPDSRGEWHELLREYMLEILTKYDGRIASSTLPWNTLAVAPETVLGVIAPLKIIPDTYLEVLSFFKQIDRQLLESKPAQLWHVDYKLNSGDQGVQEWVANTLAMITELLPPDLASILKYGAINGLPVNLIPTTGPDQERGANGNAPSANNSIDLHRLMSLQRWGLVQIRPVNALPKTGLKPGMQTASSLFESLIDPRTRRYSPERGLNKILKSLPASDALNGRHINSYSPRIRYTELRNYINTLRAYTHELNETGLTGRIIGNALTELSIIMAIMEKTFHRSRL